MITLPLEKSDLDQCLAAYGTEAECMKAIQECGELIVALTRNIEGRDSNVVEELADVLIMVVQMAYIYGYDAVCTIMIEKMKRQKQRLNA